ncbi:GerMN domain-containing protein [Paenibacillus riograndensis]|uniref:Putative spore germination protein GerM n=1 Tax=Paenibacillus riograndensis SBR5 TaxID=1073571 RepID=A0A0E4HH59_9BACL|nr:GerMN domain-containing protein [Paenibacillus riograndensis]CQR57909.1 putative spore germination protein GerM [Paenibacillus riograndensis SBR5]
MKHMKPIRGLSAACLLAVPLTLSGCGLFGSESASVDPPPSEVEAQMLQVSGEGTPDTGVLGPVALDEADLAAGVSTDTAPAAAAGERTTVFLEDGNGLLAPVSLSLPEGDNTAMLKDSLAALVSKGQYASALPEGFKGVLPAGTEVKNITVDKDKLAVVEFNSKFNDYEPADERKILEAITWTLTGQDGIQGVQLWVDGKKLTEMPLQDTPLDRPLTRALGINLPKHGPLLMNSSAVTVYFSAATSDGTHQYYVPVTRFVPAGQDTLKAALNELIAGPESEKGLEMVMTQETVLDSVEAGQNGVVTVSLNDDMFADGKGVPAEMLESVVLTVAQNSDDALVQIRMNGQKTVTGTNNVDYGQPVSAPEYVNVLPL